MVLAPGTMGGLLPFLLTGWVSHHPPVFVFAFGALLLATGAAVLLHAFARFVGGQFERSDGAAPFVHDPDPAFSRDAKGCDLQGVLLRYLSQ